VKAGFSRPPLPAKAGPHTFTNQRHVELETRRLSDLDPAELQVSGIQQVVALAGTIALGDAIWP